MIALGAVAIGFAAQQLEKHHSYAWLLIAAAFTSGAVLFSETLPASSLFEGIGDWGPQADGFYLIPGTIGAAVMGALAYIASRTHAAIRRAN